HAREVDAQEFASVSVLALPLGEASVKVRATHPGDDEEDIEANAVWAGVLPLISTYGAPVPSPDLAGSRDVPEYVSRRRYPANPRAGASAQSVPSVPSVPS
ncbi:MAG: hypothetical protein ACRDQF_10455, partial [Thermocrispum sp.]